MSLSEAAGPSAPPVAVIGLVSSWVALAGAVGYIVSVVLQLLSVMSPAQNAVLAFSASLAIAPSFLLAVLALHHTVPAPRRFWTHVATVFAGIYAALASVNYVVQLATVLPAGYSWTPADQAGTPGPLSVLDQTPHSLMWDVDGLAYVMLNVATLFAAMAFDRRGPQRWIRWILLANAAATPLFALAYFRPGFSVPVLLLGGVPWAITVPASLLALAAHFRASLPASPLGAATG